MSARPDIVCLSHLRWDGVFQRPHHLMSRFGRRGRVFYFEEPLLLGSEAKPRLDVSSRPGGVHIAQPHLASGLGRGAADAAQGPATPSSPCTTKSRVSVRAVSSQARTV